MEPIYQFATPQSIEQLKAEQEGKPETKHPSHYDAPLQRDTQGTHPYPWRAGMAFARKFVQELMKSRKFRAEL
ncbi:hypothetical protein H9Q13_00600 [Pontibacter sp. JH31]|uniref:Uncharacterized protein n=1 Tax=Pontibacter aquaedesilientis TaxID=2766980 RepID=A0ABR7XE51_9BACT|nr:hypothetical protein [Pontibacter aquaedesilientis]MBD1395651.1 hypothetical protein [Pontibacter aquaedesilientis]